MATFNPFRRRRSCWELIRENIKTMVNKVRNVSNLEEMKELNDGLQRKHVMIIHVIKMMNDDQVENFIDKLTSFIIKWIHILEEAKSAPTTKIINFFFSTDFISFHIVFFIGVNHYIYSSHLDSVFISQRSRQ